MGVAGSGKSTVGLRLAEALGVGFHDADDFHPKANVDKMASGIPLNDDDRRPWLERMAKEMAIWEGNGGGVLACSALKQAYRNVLAAGSSDVRFVFLHGTRALLEERIRGRSGHYMKPAMLDSQLATLEPPTDAIALDIADAPDELIRKAVDQLSRQKVS